MEPLAYRVEDAKRMIGCGTTQLYALAASGVLDARKLGRRTVITAESLRRFIQNLPRADLHTGQGRGA